MKKKIIIRWLVGPGTEQYYEVIKESVRFMHYHFKAADLLVCHYGLNESQYDTVREIGADTYQVEDGSLKRLAPNKWEVFINSPIIFNEVNLFREFMRQRDSVIARLDGTLSLGAFGLPPGLELPSKLDAILPFLANHHPIELKYRELGAEAKAVDFNRRWWLNAMRDGLMFTDIESRNSHKGWQLYQAYRWGIKPSPLGAKT